MARLILGMLAMTVVVGLVAFPAGRETRREGASASESQPPKDEGAARPEFKTAGVCARCHVVSVLEWGVSKHVASGTTCRDCHGPSRAHVANERNEVKPDALPRSDQIATSCLRCHEAGCPETEETRSCQKCHHVHALLDPNRRPKPDDGPYGQLLRSWERFRQHADRGEERLRHGDLQGARGAFLDALALRPGDRHAKARLELCNRRLNPDLPGFTAEGSKFDPATGLPREVTVRGLDIPMTLISAGEFDMGTDRLADARPVHTVAIEAFYLGKYEVTQAQWQSVMGANPSVHQGKAFPDAARMPVDTVSWNDCREFIKRLNERIEGGGFRLPTEAEWEFACRAGAGDPTPDDTPGPFAWFRENSRREAGDDGPGQSPAAWSPRPVGLKRANAWGIHDLRGNVSEWCASLYRPYPYEDADRRESPDDPGPRVLRGGGFADSAEGLAPALRHFDRPHRRHRWNGLRLARDVPPAR
ncbi:MAG: SUMF1/EgtB/PvdO family nonheme iron enzyme [Isosphaeraceae bacterium]